MYSSIIEINYFNWIGYFLINSQIHTLILIKEKKRGY